jgi:hypothetical protein
LPVAKPIPGDVLAKREYRLGTDFRGGDTIRFIVPPAVDCNGNLVSDDQDIAKGTSKDCNHNGIPDECDIAAGTSADLNHNGVPDECESGGSLIVLCPEFASVPAGETCQGVLPDMTHDVSVSGGSASGQLSITQSPPAGTHLSPGISTPVTFTVSDAAGHTGSCTTMVTVADVTPPTITAPPAISIGCSEPLDPSANHSLGFATAWDNCGVLISYHDAAPTVSTCSSVFVRTWTAVDAAGNFDSATQQITLLADFPSLRLTCPPDIVIRYDESTDPAHTGSASATADCTLSTQVNHWDTTGSTPAGDVLIDRTWVASDGCDHSTSCVQQITVLQPRVYWTVWGDGFGGIQSARIDGTDIRMHLNTEGMPIDLSIDPVAREMFWIVSCAWSLGCELGKAALDGSGAAALPTVLVDAHGLAVEPVSRTLYWTDLTATSQPALPTSQPAVVVYRSDLTGIIKLPIAVEPSATFPGSIAVDSGLNMVCWAQYSYYGYGSQIRSCDLLGGNSKAIYYSSANSITGIAMTPAASGPAEGQIVYWVELLPGGSSEIRRARSTADAVDAPETILTVSNELVLHLAIDRAAGKLYWTEPGTGTIGRCNLDGSQAEDFLTNRGWVVGLTVYRPQ